MKDEVFWKKLSMAAAKDNRTYENVLEFAELLMEGYRGGNALFEIGGLKENDQVFQLYIGDHDQRMMLCATTLKKGKNVILGCEKEGMLSEDIDYCVIAVPCKFLLDNLYFKKDIGAFLFNYQLDDMFVIPAEILRPMIEETGLAAIPGEFVPADKSRDKNGSNGKKSGIAKYGSVKEWAAKKCPPAYLVLVLDGKWRGQTVEDEEFAAKVFCRQWGSVKKFIEKQNKKNGKVSIEAFPMGCPDEDLSEVLTQEFFDLLNTADIFLQNTRRYKELVEYCRDLLELFDCDDHDKSFWTGIMGCGIWEQDPEAGERFFKEHLKERDDIIMGQYSFYLLDAGRREDAAEALKGYEDSEDETIIERFEWLNSPEWD